MVNDDPIGTDGDLPATARAVATSIEALTEEVGKLNTRLDRGEWRTRVLAVLVVVVFLLGMGGIALVAYINDKVSCQAEQNDAFQAASGQIRQAAASERAAQRKLFDTILNPASTPEQRRQASVDYRASLIQADLQRAGSVFPEGNCS